MRTACLALDTVKYPKPSSGYSVCKEPLPDSTRPIRLMAWLTGQDIIFSIEWICYTHSINRMNISLGKLRVLFCFPSVSMINAFNLLVNKYVLDNLVGPPSSGSLNNNGFLSAMITKRSAGTRSKFWGVFQPGLSNATIWLHALTSTKSSPGNVKY